MTGLFTRVERLAREHRDGSWGERATAQLRYLQRVSRADGGGWDALLHEAAGLLEGAGIIGEGVCSQMESLLAPMAARAKRDTLLCCSHAHIDLNFLWGYDETVSIVLATFSTMLRLLEEYPGFIYSQSQAAAYRMVEQFAPQLLPAIRRYVREGRWEVTASTWVEADKNMPDGESQVMQAVSAKRYLSRLLDLPPESLQVDFEPDTFGHSAAVPQILRGAGITGYYFCRGAGAPGRLFRWRAPDGSEVLACQEPQWYDSRIESAMALFVPEFCAENRTTCALKVYGVGDHGGGPTRRDLDRLAEIARWPLFPAVRCGSYHEFFELAAASRESLPVYEGELHSVFTGCLSAQCAVKQGNRRAETLLRQARTLRVFAGLPDPWGQALLERAWERALLNQFHDIVTGSCVREAAHFALGRAQEAAAYANTARGGALTRLAGLIDTTGIPRAADGRDDRFAGGAGAGVFVQREGRTGLAEREGGLVRVVHVCNASAFPRGEVCELLLWDWRGDASRLAVRTPEGEAVPFELDGEGVSEEWGHHYLRLRVLCDAPALGYTTLVIGEGELPGAARAAADYPLAAENRIPPECEHDFTLENGVLRAVFDGETFALRGLWDRASGRCLADGGVFELVEEDGFDGGGNAWLVGRTVSRRRLERFRLASFGRGLRQTLCFEGEFGASRLTVRVSLDPGAACLRFEAACDWHEFWREGGFVRRLQFCAHVGYDCADALYDIPMGHIVRPAMRQNVSGCRFALARAARGAQLVLASADGYGYRFADGALALTLLRGSNAPDPYAEQGEHRLCFLLGGAHGRMDAHRLAETFANPLVEVPASPRREGTLPPRRSLFALDARHTLLTCLKPGEERPGEIVVRLLEAEGRAERVSLRCPAAVAQARACDLLERDCPDVPAPEAEGDTVSVELGPYELRTLALRL